MYLYIVLNAKRIINYKKISHMTTISLQGLTKTNITKKALKSILYFFKGVKEYNDFGNEEYKVFTNSETTIAALDLNTNEVWLNLKVVVL
jgi:hypothetical protein